MKEIGITLAHTVTVQLLLPISRSVVCCRGLARCSLVSGFLGAGCLVLLPQASFSVLWAGFLAFFCVNQIPVNGDLHIWRSRSCTEPSLQENSGAVAGIESLSLLTYGSSLSTSRISSVAPLPWVSHCLPLSFSLFCFLTMSKTRASTRAGRKPKSKNLDRKWCTCQERCEGGKEVAVSTYRSHNQTAMRSVTARGSSVERGSTVLGKRKATDEEGGLDLEGGGVRETRGMRARRVARDGQMGSQLSAVVVENPIGTLELNDPQTGRKKVDSPREFYPQELTTRPTIACQAPRGPNPRIHPRRW